MYQLHRANLLDARQIRCLEKVIFPKDAFPLLDIIVMLCLPRIRNLKLITDSGELAGFVSGSMAWMGSAAWIITIGVATEHQGQGLGRRLLNACEAQLRARRIRLTVRASNHRAIGLYESSGYCTVQRRRRYYQDGEDGLIMEKLL